MNEVLEVALIGLTVVGAVAAGNAAQKVAENNGCTENQQIGAACLGVGLALAVAPVTAMAGAMVTVNAGYDAWQHRDAHKAALKAKLASAKAKINGAKPEAVPTAA